MKIGILTFQWANNYGALLQAYALCQRLAAMGHAATVIDYTPENCRAPYWKGWGLNCGRQMPANALRRYRFEQFRRKVLPLSRACNDATELKALAASLDTVIVGSDQVWNGHIVGTADRHYFLDFVSPEKTGIASYAACFGDPSQPGHTTAAAREFLPRFHYVSARNEMSAELVRANGNREAAIVTDPTMLHDFSGIQGTPPVSGHYIAAYYVSPDHAPEGRGVIREIANRLGLPVISVGSDRKVLGADESYVQAGPAEWVNALRHASFICTDSFHGTIFALKFRKPFVVWPGYRTGRLTHLLGACGIPERLLGQENRVDTGALAQRVIDFDAVESRLAPWIDASNAYLRDVFAVRSAG